MPEDFTDSRWLGLARLQGPAMRQARIALDNARLTVDDPRVQAYLRDIWVYVVLDEDFKLLDGLRARHQAETQLFNAIDTLKRCGGLPAWIEAAGLAQARAEHKPVDHIGHLATRREFNSATAAALYFIGLAQRHFGKPARTLSVAIASSLYGVLLDPDNIKRLVNTKP